MHTEIIFAACDVFLFWSTRTLRPCTIRQIISPLAASRHGNMAELSMMEARLSPIASAQRRLITSGKYEPRRAVRDQA